MTIVRNCMGEIHSSAITSYIKSNLQ